MYRFSTFLLVLASLSPNALAASGTQTRSAINSFFLLGKDQSLRMTPSIRFEREHLDCALIAQNLPKELSLTLSKGEEQVYFSVSSKHAPYELEGDHQKLKVINDEGVELILERRVPSRSPEGDEISVSISDSGENLVHCLVVR